MNKIKLISFIVLVFTISSVFSQEKYEDIEKTHTFIFDKNFEQVLVDLGYDNRIDGMIENARIKKITKLNIANSNIKDLTGIEKFTALQELYCQNNSIEHLFLGENTQLQVLDCSSNKIKAFDVTRNQQLVSLKIYNNVITHLNLTLNSSLNHIECQNNVLNTLMLKNGNNATIKVFNATNNPKLTKILVNEDKSAIENQWKIEKNTSLTTKTTLTTCVSTYVPDDNFEQALIDLGYDDILDNKVCNWGIENVTSLYIHDKNISDLTGIEGFVSLEKLSCYSNQLTSLDVTQNGALSALLCFGNNLSVLDVTQNGALSALLCFGNNLSVLDVTHNTELTQLSCSKNELTTLNVSQNTSLFSLHCYDNNLSVLDVTHNTELIQLLCSKNELTTLNVSQNTSLLSLQCYENNLSVLDVTHNTELTELSCSKNELTTLNVSQNTSLFSLHCYDNKLSVLDVTHNTELTTLLCSKNELTTLNVSQNTDLETLWCMGNQLSVLDVTFNIVLSQLLCALNDLATLNVSQNTELTSLWCHGNSLSVLDVTYNTKLSNFMCSYNQLTYLDVRNANNVILTSFDARSNPNLFCIAVDNPNLANDDSTTSYYDDWSVDPIILDGNYTDDPNCSTNTCEDPTDFIALEDDITSTTIPLQWIDNNSELPAAWYIEYGPEGFAQGDGTFVGDWDHIPSEDIIELDPNTTYDFYISALCDKENLSNWVGPVTATTLESFCVNPSSIFIVNTTSTSVTVGWENPSPPEPENGWQIKYGPTGFNVHTEGSLVSPNVPFSFDTTYTITGLNPAITYDVYIRSICPCTSCTPCPGCPPGTGVLDWVGPVTGSPCSLCASYKPKINIPYILGAWLREDHNEEVNPENQVITFENAYIELAFIDENDTFIGDVLVFKAKGSIIDGWQRVQKEFIIPAGTMKVQIELVNDYGGDAFFDDIRIFPVNGNMKSFVYDPVSRKLMAELDENNYATYYEYDNEGGLIRVKKETEKGVFTIQETRSSTVKE